MSERLTNIIGRDEFVRMQFLASTALSLSAADE